MRIPDPVLDVGARLLETSHRALLLVTGGRFPRRVLGMQPVELHVRGRKTGQRRSTMLTAPICEEDRVVLVASKGGSSDHPQWYKNLVANPEVDLTIDDRTRPMRARTATSAERDELWPRIVSVYGGYGDYQRNTDRQIPVIICEPR